MNSTREPKSPGWKIPLPTRIPMRFAAILIFLLAAIQLALGTSLSFTALVLVFLMLSVNAINKLGGLAELSGLVVAAYSLKMVLIPQIAKCLLGQAGDTYLAAPIETMGAHAVGIAAIALAANFLAILPIRRSSGPLNGMPTRILFGTYIAALALGLFSYFYIQISADPSAASGIRVGGLVGLCRQLLFFFPLSIIAAFAIPMRKSRGQRSLSLLAVLPIAFSLFIALIESSKMGILQIFLLYIITCAAFGFRFRFIQIFGPIALLVFSFIYVIPVIQVSKGVIQGTTFKETVSKAMEFYSLRVRDPDLFREVYIDGMQRKYDLEENRQRIFYYGRALNFLDRITLLGMDGLLIQETLESGTTGWATITHGFRMLPPRLLYADKPATNTGNLLARRIGLPREDDFTTQVAFGFVTDSFSAFRWTGAFFVPLLLCFAFFAVYRAMVGPASENIWFVFLLNDFQHSFVEETISGILLRTFQLPLLILAFFYFVWFASSLWCRYFPDVAPTREVA